MELSIGISSKRNPFFPGHVNSIRPDGLGVKRDGTVAVLEVKGPQDELDAWPAILQGVLGAVAIHAKREYIVQLLKSGTGRRPPSKNTRIPKTTRSMTVLVLTSAVKSNGQPAPQLPSTLSHKMRLGRTTY